MSNYRLDLFVQYSCESVAVSLDLVVTLDSSWHTLELLGLFTVHLESLRKQFEQLSDYKIKMPNLFLMCSNEFFSGDSGYLLRKKKYFVSCLSYLFKES